MKRTTLFLALSFLTALVCGGRVDSSAASDGGGAASGGSAGVGGSVSTGGSTNLGGLTASGGSVSVGGSSGGGGAPPDAATDAPLDAGPCVCPATVPEHGTPCCKPADNPGGLYCIVCGTHGVVSYTGFACGKGGSWWVNTIQYAPCPNSEP